MGCPLGPTHLGNLPVCALYIFCVNGPRWGLVLSVLAPLQALLIMSQALLSSLHPKLVAAPCAMVPSSAWSLATGASIDYPLGFNPHWQLTGVLIITCFLGSSFPASLHGNMVVGMCVRMQTEWWALQA